MSDAHIRFTARMRGAFDVARLLRRYPEKVGRTLESLVKQEARGLAVELARNTRPFGFSEAARKRGEKAVAKDIKSVFALPSDAFEKTKLADPAAADRFWANIQNRRFARAQTALRTSDSSWKDLSVGRLDPAHHKSSRDARGRVTRRNPAQIVTSAKSLDTYIGRTQKRVGFAKGAWINAAKAIGGRVRGAAQWTTRHKQAPGTATVKTGDKPSVSLINKLDYIEQVSTRTGIDLALQVAAGRLRRALATSLRAINDRANRSLRRRAG
ncbi:MAG: hypothetical protein EOP21_03560 [Hyphomicrobiales bacterium]|nr:MAG: hypothetical protein EOP21_03560 [Hyphomicrobiales bacterium]